MTTMLIVLVIVVAMVTNDVTGLSTLASGSLVKRSHPIRSEKPITALVSSVTLFVTIRKDHTFKNRSSVLRISWTNWTCK